MSATRYLLAAMVLGSAISATQANAQCSGNAGGCLTVNTASATVNALVKLGMSGTTTTLTSSNNPAVISPFPASWAKAQPSRFIFRELSSRLKSRPNLASLFRWREKRKPCAAE